jgi:pimeloyl-ACP methyl ester carboxylesterase
VFAAWWVSHLELDYKEPRFRHLFDELAERYTVIRYDRAGAGLSDRERKDYTLRSEADDLDAVVGAAGLDTFGLVGISCGGPPSIAFAVEHPERVERLLLYGSFLSGEQIGPAEVLRAVAELVHAHWGIGARTIVDLFAPNLTREEVKNWIERQRQSASRETAAALLELTYAMDVRTLAPRLGMPVRVVHRRGDRTVHFECGRSLAAAIPNASLVALDGEAHVPWEGDGESFLREVVTFFGGKPAPDVAAEKACATLQREGDFWLVAFEGKAQRLRHAKGLADLAVLLAEPGRTVHVLSLMESAFADGADTLTRQPVLDERAFGFIRERLRDLDLEIGEAETNADIGRVERLRAEREAVQEELRLATRQGGRGRAMPDASERARTAVAGRLRDAIDRIRSVHDGLGAHLDASIKTGTQCSYEPDQPIFWQL